MAGLGNDVMKFESCLAKVHLDTCTWLCINGVAYSFRESCKDRV